MSVPTTHLKLLYFAWVREKIGRASETVDVPANVETVADLIAWLKTRGDEYQRAFETTNTVRAAIDHTHAKHDAKIGSAREIAFFPPVTGG